MILLVASSVFVTVVLVVALISYIIQRKKAQNSIPRTDLDSLSITSVSRQSSSATNAGTVVGLMMPPDSSEAAQLQAQQQQDDITSTASGPGDGMTPYQSESSFVYYTPENSFKMARGSTLQAPSRLMLLPVAGANGAVGAQRSKSDLQDSCRRRVRHCIFALLVSDLLFCVLYFPTQIMRLNVISDNLPPNVSYALLIVSSMSAEIAEAFVIASGLWTLFVVLEIWRSVRTLLSASSSQRSSTSSNAPVASRPTSQQSVAPVQINRNSSSEQLEKQNTSFRDFKRLLASTENRQKAQKQQSSHLSQRLLTRENSEDALSEASMDSVRISSSFSNKRQRSADDLTDERASTVALEDAFSAQQGASIGQQEKRILTLWHFLAWLPPLALSVIDIVAIDILSFFDVKIFPTEKQQNIYLYFMLVIYAFVHLIIYVAIWLAIVIVNLRITITVAGLLNKTRRQGGAYTGAADRRRSLSEKRRAQQRTRLKLVLYSLPFVLSTSVLLLQRLFVIIDMIWLGVVVGPALANQYNSPLAPTLYFVKGLHYILSVSRPLLDTIVFFLMASPWRTFKRRGKAQSDQKSARSSTSTVPQSRIVGRPQFYASMSMEEGDAMDDDYDVNPIPLETRK